MARFHCLSFVCVFVFVFVETIAQNSRIINGEIVQISKHPYIVSVHRRNFIDIGYEHACGGIIYNENIILTAASCVNPTDSYNILIVAGSSFRSNYLKDGGMIFPVAEVIIHPDNKIDLAVVRLALKLPLHNSLNMQAVTLAATTPPTGTLAVIAGWGRIEQDGPYSEELREATVPILDLEPCKALSEWIDEITDNHICAGYNTGTGGRADVCSGDDGGPLLVKGQLVGITSWGISCGRPGKLGVYTDVVKLNNWILSHVQGVRIDFL